MPTDIQLLKERKDRLVELIKDSSIPGALRGQISRKTEEVQAALSSGRFSDIARFNNDLEELEKKISNATTSQAADVGAAAPTGQRPQTARPTTALRRLAPLLKQPKTPSRIQNPLEELRTKYQSILNRENLRQQFMANSQAEVAGIQRSSEHTIREFTNTENEYINKLQAILDNPNEKSKVKDAVRNQIEQTTKVIDANVKVLEAKAQQEIAELQSPEKEAAFIAAQQDILKKEFIKDLQTYYDELPTGVNHNKQALLQAIFGTNNQEQVAETFTTDFLNIHQSEFTDATRSIRTFISEQARQQAGMRASQSTASSLGSDLTISVDPSTLIASYQNRVSDATLKSEHSQLVKELDDKINEKESVVNSAVEQGISAPDLLKEAKKVIGRLEQDKISLGTEQQFLEKKHSEFAVSFVAELDTFFERHNLSEENPVSQAARQQILATVFNNDPHEAYKNIVQYTNQSSGVAHRSLLTFTSIVQASMSADRASIHIAQDILKKGAVSHSKEDQEKLKQTAGRLSQRLRGLVNGSADTSPAPSPAARVSLPPISTDGRTSSSESDKNSDFSNTPRKR